MFPFCLWDHLSILDTASAEKWERCRAYLIKGRRSSPNSFFFWGWSNLSFFSSFVMHIDWFGKSVYDRSEWRYTKEKEEKETRSTSCCSTSSSRVQTSKKRTTATTRDRKFPRDKRRRLRGSKFFATFNGLDDFLMCFLFYFFVHKSDTHTVSCKFLSLWGFERFIHGRRSLCFDSKHTTLSDYVDIYQSELVSPSIFDVRDMNEKKRINLLFRSDKQYEA